MSATGTVREGEAPAGDAGVQKRNFLSSLTDRKPSFFLYEVDARDMVAGHVASSQRQLLGCLNPKWQAQPRRHHSHQVSQRLLQAEVLILIAGNVNIPRVT